LLSCFFRNVFLGRLADEQEQEKEELKKKPAGTKGELTGWLAEENNKSF
jgi:hypothetical protein